MISEPGEGRFTSGVVDVLDLANVKFSDLVYGEVSAEAGAASIEYIKAAVSLAMGGQADAICTAPINKEAINAGGYNYAGHTQLLAELTGTQSYVMMLACSKLKVALATTHLALRDVPSVLTVPRILNTIITTNAGMQDFFNLERPRLALCALNPHGGEAGLFGNEEETILKPAVLEAQAKGIDIGGPHPADTLFVKAVAGDYDAVVTLYHDQGLIPIKLLGFGAATNLTLGLPIIRTSVDHGTAFDIVTRYVANAGSLLEALRTASAIAVLRAGRKPA